MTTTSRRDFLKRSAATGAVAWAAPTIATLPGGLAWADTYQRGTPDCDAEATGLIVRLLGDDVLVLGRATKPADGEDCTVRVGRIDEQPDGSITYEARSVLGLFRIAAEVGCAQVVDADGNCKAIARVVDLVIELRGDHHDDQLLLGGVVAADHDERRQAVRIQLARAEATTGNPATGDSFVAKVTDPHGRDLDVRGDCGFDVDVAGLFRVKVNEQICRDDGTLIVRAVRVLIPSDRGGLVEVIAAEARARGDSCQACSP